ncbi:MAG TPA: class C sortase [Microbacteriaceae bacterium]|nr:class C sortase [Microbacteriaceae bacterium]
MKTAELTQNTKPSVKKQRKGQKLNTLLLIVAIFSIGLLTYPEAANWVSSIGHNSEISGYVKNLEKTPSAKRAEILQAAYEYNDKLQPGPLADPYITENQDEAIRSEVYKAYEKMLRITGSQSIGTVNYPKLGIALPIYHGTADKTISKGVGHLYGTSLPIGGPSTHSVLTAHSGLPNSKLFTSLLKAEVGETFWISVLGEDHHYEVKEVETVLPGETDKLTIREGEDWVTLFTCSPIGINSHRYMVHAVRTADQNVETNGTLSIGGDGVSLGFPWWAVWLVGGSTLVGLFLFRPARKNKGSDKLQTD